MYTLIARFTNGKYERVFAYKKDGSVFAGYKNPDGTTRWYKAVGTFKTLTDVCTFVGVCACNNSVFGAVLNEEECEQYEEDYEEDEDEED